MKSQKQSILLNNNINNNVAPMYAHLLSDIHLEFVNNADYIKKLIPCKSNIRPNILILAGDIGNPRQQIYKSFLTEISKHYDKIFIITGNHEYYNITTTDTKCIDDIDSIIRNIVLEIPNIHFLQRNSYIYNRVRFLGCTLWSIANPKLTWRLNDFKCISDMDADKYTNMFLRDSTWLYSQLSKNSEEYDHTVVITHHLPTYKLISDKYKDNICNCFFANHLDNLINMADVWVCGHSHMAKNIKIGKCRCYLNPVGYSSENTGFDSNFIINLTNENLSI